MTGKFALSSRALATAAFGGIAQFPIVLIGLNLVQKDHYSALAQPASQLALGQGGWVMFFAFSVLGLGMIALALFIRGAVAGAVAVPVILGVVGVMDFVVAVFTTDPTGVQLTVHGLIHNTTGLASFVLEIVAIVVAGFSFRRSPQWRSFSRTTFIWAGIAIGAFVLLFALSPLNLFGLAQRISVATHLSWFLVVAWRGIT